MAQTLAYSYAALEKADKNADGTLTVYGKATDDSIDIDQQICDNEWLKQAMPEWMSAGGNVREQHSAIAAGVATDYEAKSDGHYITALVVDPVSVKKVETGVLKGFSIGIRNPRVIRDEKAVGGRIAGGTIVEISLVDRPANPNAKLMLAKAAESGELMKVKQGVPTPKDVFVGKSPVDADGSIVGTVDVSEESPVIGESSVADAVVDAPVDDAVVDIVADEPTPIAELGAEADQVDPVDEADKGAVADTVKADDPAAHDALYADAIAAIVALIKAEADELVGGDDERGDIKHLLKAQKHLEKWHKREADKGEVTPVETDDVMDDDDEMTDVIELSVDADEMKMCDKCDKSMDDCKCADKSVTIDFNDDQIGSIVEKAVASAKASVAEELETLRDALKAAEADKVQIIDELETAKKAIAGGGPKRSVTGKPETQINDLLVKAAGYRAKAKATLDHTLAKGYKELAKDLEAKASRKDVN